MSDNPQQPDQPPAGPGWGQPPTLPPNDPAQQPGYQPPPGYAPQPGYEPPQAPAPGWGQPQQPGYPPQPGWGQPQPGWGPPQQPGYPPQQPGYPPQQGYPQQGGWGTPPPAYPQSGYPQPGYPQPGYQPQPAYGYPPRYAGFWIRFGAYLIDGLVLFGLVILCMITIVGIFALPFIAIGYMPWMWWKKGGTVGQKALGLRVVREQDGGPIDGTQATVRFLGSLISGWALYLGYIWVAFEPRKRGWHDMMAGTVVIHVN